MELKVDKTTKILLGAIALGLFLNASNVFIDKAHAKDKIQKVVICNQYMDEHDYTGCAHISNGALFVKDTVR